MNNSCVFYDFRIGELSEEGKQIDLKLWIFSFILLTICITVFIAQRLFVQKGVPLALYSGVSIFTLLQVSLVFDKRVRKFVADWIGPMAKRYLNLLTVLSTIEPNRVQPVE
jgi:hypothetical protein